MQAIHCLLERQQFNGNCVNICEISAVITEFISVVCEIRAEKELSNVSCPWLYVEVTFLLLLLKIKHIKIFLYFLLYVKETSSVKKGKKTIVWQKMRKIPCIPCIISNVLRHLLSVVSYICFSSLVCCYGTLADSG